MEGCGKGQVGTSRALCHESVKALLDSVETFIFDCDGVISWQDKLIEGVAQTLEMLRSRGKKLFFVTNSKKSRTKYREKLLTRGVEISEDEILTSSFAAAMFLKTKDFPQEKKVYVIGEEGSVEELELAGYTCLGGPVGAVVVGFDRHFNYYKLQYGALCIRENPGCLFISTNPDTMGPEWIGAGCLVAAMCASTQKEPIVVGKPSTFLMDFLLKKYKIHTSKMCMVGDRLDTDILFGQNAGCKTLLVLSGGTTLSALQEPSNNIQPDYYTGKLSDLIQLLGPKSE